MLEYPPLNNKKLDRFLHKNMYAFTTDGNLFSVFARMIHFQGVWMFFISGNPTNAFLIRQQLSSNALLSFSTALIVTYRLFVIPGEKEHFVRTNLKTINFFGTKCQKMKRRQKFPQKNRFSPAVYGMGVGWGVWWWGCRGVEERIIRLFFFVLHTQTPNSIHFFLKLLLLLFSFYS